MVDLITVGSLVLGFVAMFAGVKIFDLLF